MIAATVYSDPACPWAYSEAPALRVIEWRYGDQLEWCLVLIGLSEDTSRAAAAGYTPTTSAIGRLVFRDRYGMPFTSVPKARLAASSRACRVVIAARLRWPGSEWRVFRALQLENFTGSLLLDDDDQLRVALADVAGIDADLVVAEIESPAVLAAYEADKAQARTAAGTPNSFSSRAKTA